ncbi:MAG: glycosyltransferase family 39 protein, partial [Acidobacteriota bacterium]
LTKWIQEGDKTGLVKALPAVGIILSGIFFRLYQSTEQILVDDEWHAVHKILMSDYWGIFTDFGMADHCIPFTLLYEFLLNKLWISELMMRLPSITAGFLALLVVPLLLRRIIGNKAAVVTACLLSISPLHVFYSRIARPYALSMLLSFIAVRAFYFWWTEKGKAWISVYVITGVSSVWCLLPALPFVAGPFLFAVLHSAFRKDLKHGVRRLLVPGISFIVGLLVLLLPPFMSKPGAIWEKAGRDTVTVQSLIGSCELFAGTSHLWLVVVMTLLSAAGVFILIRKNSLFGLYSLVLVWLQIIGFLIAGPLGSPMSILLNRYAIAVLPFILAWVALPLVQKTGIKWRSKTIKYSFILLFFLLLFFGPFREIYFYPNHLTNYAGFQISYDLGRLRKMIKPPDVPPFYRELAGFENGQKIVLEAPWHYNDNIYGFYQWLHRQHMYIGFVGDLDGTFRAGEVPVNDSRFRFRNFMHVSDFRKIEKRGVDFVIFHKELEKERVSDIPVYVANVRNWIEMYRERYGQPEYEDHLLTVFRIP